MIEPESAAVPNLRPIDEQLLGFEPDPNDPTAMSFVVVPHLCRTDGRFYGGAALAAALAASEAVSGRPALWSSTQLVAVADQNDRIQVRAEILASGRTADQVQVRGSVGDRIVFNAIGTAATPRADGLSGSGLVMPRVPPPDDCTDWMMRERHELGAGERPKVGHHLVSEHRDAPFLDEADERPGHMAVWARLADNMRPATPTMTPAVIGFLADLVPLAVSRACGVSGAGTSLDNSLRIGEPLDTDWVLLDLDAHVAVGGFGHGHVHVWSPDGRMLATGTQSARLFTIQDFLDKQEKRASPPAS